MILERLDLDFRAGEPAGQLVHPGFFSLYRFLTGGLPAPGFPQFALAARQLLFGLPHGVVLPLRLSPGALKGLGGGGELGLEGVPLLLARFGGGFQGFPLLQVKLDPRLEPVGLGVPVPDPREQAAQGLLA